MSVSKAWGGERDTYSANPGPKPSAGRTAFRVGSWQRVARDLTQIILVGLAQRPEEARPALLAGHPLADRPNSPHPAMPANIAKRPTGCSAP
jgi:hypothetical protein